MPAMRSATATRSKPCECQWLLVGLVCGAFASGALAQTEPGTADSVVVERDEVVTVIAPEGGTAIVTDDATDSTESAADTVGRNEQFVASTVEQFGRKSLQAAEAYVGLADANRNAQQYADLTAVEIYRAVDGPFTALAIGPLTSLGDSYREDNDDGNAVSAYSEARTVSRRAYGLHNEEQIALLDRLSQSLLDLNQLAEAEEQQVEALRLIQRANPPSSDAVLEGIYKYAEWLGQRLMFQLERDQYMRALRIIRSTYGERDVRQVHPLVGIGNTYRQERNPAGMGISSLQEGLALLLEQPERDSVAIAGTLRDIGDWSVAFDKTGYRGMEYQRAWQLLGSVPDGERLRREWFYGANYVLYEPISPRGLSNDPDALGGHVTVSFDVDTAGNSGNVTLVSSAPVGLKDEAVLRHIRRSRFRPLIENGELVAARGLAIQVKFRYLQEAGATDDED
jgi:TonB family protein